MKSGKPLVLKEVVLDKIVICEDYTRAVVDREHLKTLTRSIEMFHQETPLLVVPGETEDTYVLLDGYHRYKSLEAAKKEKALVLVCFDIHPDKELIIEALLHANVHKELNSVDLAKFAYLAVEKERVLTQDKVAKIFGVSPSRISEWIKVYKMPELQEGLHSQSIPMQTAVQLANMEKKDRDFLLEWGGKKTPEGKLSGFATKHLVAKLKKFPTVLEKIKKENIPLVVGEAVAGAVGIEKEQDIVEFFDWYGRNKDKMPEDQIVKEIKKKIQEVKRGESIFKVLDRYSVHSLSNKIQERVYDYLITRHKKFQSSITIDADKQQITITVVSKDDESFKEINDLITKGQK